MICSPWQVVVVPFPFVDLPRSKRRPALVLSHRSANESMGHSVLAMITRGVAGPLPNDIPIQDLDAAGLRTSSVVRWKLFSLDNRLLLESIGALQRTDRIACGQELATLLALPANAEGA